jgi:hypothetical protein
LKRGGADADPAPTLPDKGLDAKCSGSYVTYCDVALDGDERVRPECNCCGDEKDKVGGLVSVYSPGAGVCSKWGTGAGTGTGIGMIVSGGRAVLGVSALDHSSSGSGFIEDVTAAAASGDAYSAVGLNDGGRGRGAWRRGSGA